MPIFPRYGGISTDVSYDKAVAAPSDPAPKQLQQLGAATEQLGGAMNQAANKAQELEDVAEAQKRYMMMVTESESMTESLNVPENAKNAKQLFGQFVEERMPKWTEGLNQRQTDLFQKQSFQKRLEYTVGAGKLQNRAKLEDYSATMVKAENHYAQKAARIVGREDGTKTDEWDAYVRMGEAGVNAGYIKPDKWEEMKDKALKQGTSTRVYQATASNNIEEVKAVLELYEEEKKSEGSTFLKHMEAKERVSLEKQLKERVSTLQNEKRRAKKEEDEDTAKMNVELSKATKVLAAQKLSNPETYGTLTRDWLDQAGRLRLLDDKELIYYGNAVDKVAQSGTPQTGGRGNAEVIGRFSVDVYDPSITPQVRMSRLKAEIAKGNIPIGAGSVGSQWMNSLEEKIKGAGEAGKPPTMAAQTDDVAQLIKQELTVTGPFAKKINDAERSVKSEALRMLQENAEAGYPKTPRQIYNDNIDNWAARVGEPADYKARELRSTSGLPFRIGKGSAKKGDTSLEERRISLQERMSQTPPGPTGDAQRRALLAEVRTLNRIAALETASDRFADMRETGAAETKIRKEEAAGGAPPQPRR
jgi:hypothetical protein